MLHQVLPSPEDYGDKLQGKPLPTNEDVDRARR